MKKKIDEMAEKTFGISKTFALKNQICVMCRQSAQKFKDKLSEKEYLISGMCQKCQDEYFG